MHRSGSGVLLWVGTVLLCFAACNGDSGSGGTGNDAGATQDGGGPLDATTDNDAWAFVASGFALAAAIGQLFISLYPNVMVSSTNHAYNLTVNNAAAGHYGLVVMTVVAVLFFPIVLLYQGWSFHVFRRRVRAPATTSETAAPATSVTAPAAPSS